MSVILLTEYEDRNIQKYLLDDIENDWFQDPIKYQDYVRPEFVDKLIEDLNNNAGKYRPKNSQILYIPKNNFTVRYSLETNYYDRLMYFYLTVPFIEEFDKYISYRVFNSRLSSKKDQLYCNAVDQWDKFDGITRTQGFNRYTLVTDIQNYYENIDINILRSDIEVMIKECNANTERKIKLSLLLDNLYSCLITWSIDRCRGLPQNRDCSSFLANIYLRNVDSFMIEKKYDYYRFMDDIRVLCKDRYEARRAMKDLVNILREKNLSLNGKKTEIIEPKILDNESYLRRKYDLKIIDALLNSKKRGNVVEAYNMIKEIYL